MNLKQFVSVFGGNLNKHSRIDELKSPQPPFIKGGYNITPLTKGVASSASRGIQRLSSRNPPIKLSTRSTTSPARQSTSTASMPLSQVSCRLASCRVA